MEYILLGLFLLLEFAANTEVAEGQVLLELLQSHLCKGLAEVRLVLGHEVLDLAVHLATKELQPQDGLVLVQSSDELGAALA